MVPTRLSTNNGVIDVYVGKPEPSRTTEKDEAASSSKMRIFEPSTEQCLNFSEILGSEKRVTSIDHVWRTETE